MEVVHKFQVEWEIDYNLVDTCGAKPQMLKTLDTGQEISKRDLMEADLSVAPPCGVHKPKVSVVKHYCDRPQQYPCVETRLIKHSFQTGPSFFVSATAGVISVACVCAYGTHIISPRFLHPQR